MFKNFVKRLSRNPRIFCSLRKIIEFDFIAIKQIIKKEFCLNKKECFPLNSDKKILDVPCGTGEFSLLFEACSYVGIDISQEYIDYAKENYNRKFYCRNAIHNGFDDACFDNVLILGFFHHLNEIHIERVLQETKRVLKLDGKVLLIEDAPVRSQWNIAGKLLQYLDVGSNIRPPEEYFSMIRRHFEIVKYYPIRNGFWNYSVFVLSHKQN